MSEFQEAYDRVDRHVTARMGARRTPGLGLALFDRERCVRASTYGFADPEARTPVRANTLFGIGSITKSFTAVAVVQAAERGLLDLHVRVTEYLPWFEVRSAFSPITLHHLLAHSAGIVGVIDQSPDTRGAAWALRETDTAWAPGERFYYSDAGYQVLALVLEAALGQPFPEILRANIFEPLGMADSEPAFVHAIRPRMARGYRDLYDDRPHHPSHPLVPAAWIEMNAGDCCIAATAEDLARFARMLLNGGRGPQGEVISRGSCDLLTQTPMATEYGFAYGYGLEVHEREGFRHIGHGGGMPGYEAFMLMDVDNGLGLTLVSTQPSVDVRSLAFTVMGLWRRAYLGEPLDGVDLSLADASRVQNAADFAGTYHRGDQTLVLSAEGEHLALHYGGGRISLEARGRDRFTVNHPDFDRFLLTFERASKAGDAAGEVVEVHHGADWWVKDRYAAPTDFDIPPEWDAYPGHYRSHIPWEGNNFRVILRKGALWLVRPEGKEEPLTPLRGGLFRVGDEWSPERLRFSQVAGGQALCASISGSVYYRFFTP